MGKSGPLFPTFVKMLKAKLGDIIDQGANDIPELMAEDGVMEFPYAPSDMPKQVIGRTNIASYLGEIIKLISFEEISEPRVYRTIEPNVVIIEFSANGHGVKTGLRYNQNYVSIITVEDGHIVNYREYWNPVAIAETLGTMNLKSTV